MHLLETVVARQNWWLHQMVLVTYSYSNFITSFVSRTVLSFDLVSSLASRLSLFFFLRPFFLRSIYGRPSITTSMTCRSAHIFRF